VESLISGTMYQWNPGKWNHVIEPCISGALDKWNSVSVEPCGQMELCISGTLEKWNPV